MTNDPKVPRKVWIAERSIGLNISNRVQLFSAVFEQPQNPGWTKFIEASEVTKLQAEVKMLRESLGMLDHVGLPSPYDKIVRDALKESETSE